MNEFNVRVQIASSLFLNSNLHTFFNDHDIISLIVEFVDTKYRFTIDLENFTEVSVAEHANNTLSFIGPVHFKIKFTQSNDLSMFWNIFKKSFNLESIPCDHPKFRIHANRPMTKDDSQNKNLFKLRINSVIPDDRTFKSEYIVPDINSSYYDHTIKTTVNQKNYLEYVDMNEIVLIADPNPNYYVMHKDILSDILYNFTKKSDFIENYTKIRSQWANLTDSQIHLDQKLQEITIILENKLPKLYSSEILRFLHFDVIMSLYRFTYDLNLNDYVMNLVRQVIQTLYVGAKSYNCILRHDNTSDTFIQAASNIFFMTKKIYKTFYYSQETIYLLKSDITHIYVNKFDTLLPIFKENQKFLNEKDFDFIIDLIKSFTLESVTNWNLYLQNLLLLRNESMFYLSLVTILYYYYICYSKKHPELDPELCRHKIEEIMKKKTFEYFLHASYDLYIVLSSSAF